VAAVETRAGVDHPLDPLSAEEIRRAVAILERERGVDARWRFAWIELREPSKQLLIDGVPGAGIARQALVVCWNRDGGATYKAVISLEDDRVLSWEHRPGEHAAFTLDEDRECAEALREDPHVAAALARRGIHDLQAVHFETWGLGRDEVPERHRGKRVGCIDIWRYAGAGRNPYAQPVSGLHFLVDLNAMALLEIEDSFTVEPPEVMGEHLPAHVPGQRLREDLKPLEIVQPDGTSFTLEGRLLRWQKWSMRLGFTPREGLVIHTLGYEDGGRVRPVAHRLSLAELVSPYRDPSPDHRWRMAYDAGEWGLGLMANSLARGCDCLGEITYVDAIVHDSRGEPHTKKNAICIHEEDDAVLWKHLDPFTGAAEVRRRRRLVVSFHATIANYDYLVYWRFYQDGSIECEVRATGIMITTQFAEGARPPYGGIVDERTYAPYHQHFVVARLDLDVDGQRNTVHMTELEPLALGAENPDGLAVVQRSTPLRSESEGRQDYDWRRQRAWVVVNEHVTNRLGTPVGYKLVPSGCVPAMIDPSSGAFRRAQAMGHDLWVTRHADDERWPCGEFVVQSKQDTGLPAWTAANRSIEDTDVVLWHVFGLFHETRAEDWPVMPVDTTSFWLKPVGFFDRNPALDVPPNERAAGSCHAQGGPDAELAPSAGGSGESI
jgi:primary-amine oxidase